MDEPKRVSLVWLLLAALFAVVIVFDIAYADGHECQGGHNCNDTNSTIAIDSSNVVSNSVSDSSRAYGFGLGDVAITQCYRSYQILIFQDSKINPICLADSLDAKGLHHTAAMVRCDIKAIRKHFDSDESCVQATTMQMIHPVAMESPKNDDEDNERYDALYARMSDIETQRIQEAESARKAAIRANTAARELEQKQAERRIYAQQTIQKVLGNDPED